MKIHNHHGVTEYTEMHGESTEISVLLTRNFLPSCKEFPLGGFLGVLCVLAVNADTQFNRQVAKYAKKTPSKAIWLRLGCSVLLRRKFFAAWKEFFPEFSWDRTPLACMCWPLDYCCTLEAGSVRSQEYGPPPRLCGEIFLVAAGPRQESPCTP